MPTAEKLLPMSMLGELLVTNRSFIADHSAIKKLPATAFNHWNVHLRKTRFSDKNRSARGLRCNIQSLLAADLLLRLLATTTDLSANMPTTSGNHLKIIRLRWSLA